MTKEPGWIQLGLAGRNGPLVGADAACNLIFDVCGLVQGKLREGCKLVLYSSLARLGGQQCDAR